MNNKEFLFKLLKMPSPSGYELPIQKLIIEEMKPFAEKFYCHHNYNLVTAINTDSKVKVLLSGHIDEIGLYIEEILKDGTCKLGKTGGIRPYMYAGQHVQVIVGPDNYIDGVIGYVPDMGKNELKISDLVLDIGSDSEELTKKLVKVGQAVIHKNDYVELSNNRLSARALDDRLGAFICLEALKEAKEANAKAGVYVSTTVGEETTGRGAMAAADEIKPTCAIVIDVTYASDLKYRENLRGNVALSKGPVLTIGSIMNDALEKAFRDCAKKLNMNIQEEVSSSSTFTDADDIYSRQCGIPTYLISIPLRYMHSSVEVCDYKDVEDIIKLLVEFLKMIDESFSFDPFI